MHAHARSCRSVVRYLANFSGPIWIRIPVQHRYVHVAVMEAECEQDQGSCGGGGR